MTAVESIRKYKEQYEETMPKIATATESLLRSDIVLATQAYGRLDLAYQDMIVATTKRVPDEIADLHEKAQEAVLHLHEKYGESLKNNPSIKTAELGEPDEWGNYKCLRCGYDYLSDEDRYCSRCGSYMTNHKPERRLHWFCNKCGTEEKNGPFTSHSCDPEGTMEFTCNECGEVNMSSFAEAYLDIVPDIPFFDGYPELPYPKSVLKAALDCSLQCNTEDQCYGCEDCPFVNVLEKHGLIDKANDKEYHVRANEIHNDCLKFAFCAVGISS